MILINDVLILAARQTLKHEGGLILLILGLAFPKLFSETMIEDIFNFAFYLIKISLFLTFCGYF